MDEVKKQANWRLKLDENENVYGCSDAVLNIAKRLVGDDISKEPNGEKLINKISEKYEINKNNILLSTSSKRAIKDLIELQKGEVIELEPFWDLSILKENITQKTKIVIISSPHKITGEALKASAIELLIKEFSNVLFVLECDYINFSTKVAFEDYVELIKYNNIAIVKEFSKDYALVGFKVGFILANEKIIEKLKREVIDDISATALNCAQIALSENTRLEDIKELNEKAKEYFIRELNLRGFNVKETEANFILCDFKDYCEFYFEKLLKNSVLTKKFFEKLELSSYLRITIPTMGGVKYFLELLNKKDALIFDFDEFLFENVSIEMLEKISKKYDLIAQSSDYLKTKEILEKYGISKYFYLLKDGEIASIINSIQYENVKYFSANVNNIIKANMANIETIGVLIGEINYQNMMNNFRHIGVNDILDDINKLDDYLTLG